MGDRSRLQLARKRATWRALQRLREAYPATFMRLMEEEMAKENGTTPGIPLPGADHAR